MDKRLLKGNESRDAGNQPQSECEQHFHGLITNPRISADLTTEFDKFLADEINEQGKIIRANSRIDRHWAIAMPTTGHFRPMPATPAMSAPPQERSE
jgi:hypothetical protein